MLSTMTTTGSADSSKRQRWALLVQLIGAFAVLWGAYELHVWWTSMSASPVDRPRGFPLYVVVGQLVLGSGMLLRRKWAAALFAVWSAKWAIFYLWRTVLEVPGLHPDWYWSSLVWAGAVIVLLLIPVAVTIFCWDRGLVWRGRFWI